MSTRKNNDFEDRIAGALFGFAVGDALGATTEFETARSIKEKYGVVSEMIGGGWLNLLPGEVTDDTQMMLCVIDAIEHSGGVKHWFAFECSQNFIKWYEGNPKDIGNQCRKGISHMIGAMSVIGETIIMPYEEDAMGNGSLMRSLPCALINEKNWNLMQAKMTHNNSSCNNTVELYHDTVQRYLSGDFENVKCSHMQPTGCVVNTFENALYWVQSTQTLPDAILGAVNEGGDADTIAAVTGSLAGLKYGYSAIPERWVAKLDESVKVRLKKFENFVKNYLQASKSML